jgi:hypothetical protein
MTLKGRILRLERKARHPPRALGEISNAELDARIFMLAEELQSAGELEPDMVEQLKSTGLWGR